MKILNSSNMYILRERLSFFPLIFLLIKIKEKHRASSFFLRYVMDIEQEDTFTPVCGCCVKYGTDLCPNREKVSELTYVEWFPDKFSTLGSFLTKEQKRESWIHCEDYFD